MKLNKKQFVQIAGLLAMVASAGLAVAATTPGQVTKKAAPKSIDSAALAESDADGLALRKEDLLDENDKSWFPGLKASPNDYLEDLEIPKRSQADTDDTKTI